VHTYLYKRAFYILGIEAQSLFLGHACTGLSTSSGFILSIQYCPITIFQPINSLGKTTKIYPRYVNTDYELLYSNACSTCYL